MIMATQEMERRVELAGLAAEVAAIHRENAKRDIVINSMAAEIKELLELANKSKGGFWAGMAIASLAGSILTWIITHTGIGLR